MIPRPAIPRLPRRRGAATSHAGLVHAPGRSQPARVPRGARRRLDPRRDQAARAGGRDHAPAGAPLRRRRGGAVQRHRRAGPRRRIRDRRHARHRPGRRAAVAHRPPICDRLRPLQPDDVDYVAATVELLVAELPADVPLLAFAGAPFTVASYLIEGRPSRDYRHTKALMHTDEALWHAVMERLADSAITFIDVQLAARGGGVPAVRLVGRHAVGRRLRAVRAPPLATGVRRARRAPSRRRRASTSGSAATTCSRRCTPPATGDRARLAHPDRRRAAPARRRRSSCRATSTRRSCWPAPTPALAGAAAVLADNAGHPGSHLQPRPRRAPRHRPRRAGRARRTRARRAPVGA